MHSVTENRLASTQHVQEVSLFRRPRPGYAHPPHRVSGTHRLYPPPTPPNRSARLLIPMLPHIGREQVYYVVQPRFEQLPGALVPVLRLRLDRGGVRC